MPTIPIITSRDKFQVGSKVNFRGDFKQKRIWRIKKSGEKFTTIEADDKTGLNDGDDVKVVTAMDISPVNDVPHNAPYMDPISPIGSLEENKTVNQNGGENQPTAIHFAPVFNMNSNTEQSGGEMPMPIKIPMSAIKNDELSGGDIDLSEPDPKPPSGGSSTSRTADLLNFDNLVVKKSN